ncbi:DUF5678 domain-containing protein [Flavobacterium mekongense]|uniref:DUF5678 domain-containing protein n=1 Tax=Flavobacterium mekongense TaxID=3379707 RepID=UPI00399B08B8
MEQYVVPLHVNSKIVLNTYEMLDKEFKYYLENQEKLVKDYEGKFIVIIGEEVVGAFNTEQEAYFDSERKYKSGTFLVQFCEKGEGSYTQTFHSRVSF